MCGGPHQWYTFSYVHVLEVCYYSQGFKTRISCGDAANPLIPLQLLAHMQRLMTRGFLYVGLDLMLLG